MESGLLRVLKSSFLYWLVTAGLCLYFFISFDIKKFNSFEGSWVHRVINASKFKNLKLGIDLQGGTRLMLRVDDSKVVENRLVDIGKSVVKVLQEAGVTIDSRGLTDGVLSLMFFDQISSDKALKIIKGDYKNFDVTQNGLSIRIAVPAAEKNRLVDLSTDKAVDILKNRLDAMDLRGLLVSRHGLSNVVVQLPGVEDISDIKEAISRAAKLEFKLVYDHAGSEEALLDKYDGILPSDRMIVLGKEGGAYLVSVFADIAGSRISDARAVYDGATGQPVVSFSLDAEGARDFREVTRENIGMSLAVIMDDKVVQAPRIQSEIGKERGGQITGVKQQEGVRMAQLLRSGSLDSPMVIEQEVRVGASLGTDSISQGLMACVFALAMLLIFSLLYYKTAGLLATIALLYNILVLLVMLALLKATLTLPGIAAIVLTVGMAIDASVLIFERIKEEFRTGLVTFSKAVDVGFEGAIAVILDSNITTFLAGVVLFWYGSPNVKGFAVSLMVGIVSTIITGVFFLRSMFDFVFKVLGKEKMSI